MITGGLKVDLAEVEALAGRWAGSSAAAEAVVVAVPDAEWGTLVVAVTDGRGRQLGGPGATAPRDPLPGVRRSPAGCVRLDPLPRLASGKIDRRGIAATSRSRRRDR